MIYCDPTEINPQTRLPQAVIDVSSPLPGLERATGADLLVTPPDTPTLARVTKARPHLDRLRKMCRVGALIQRKSGGDLVASVPHLSNIEARMQEWTPWPILLYTGHFERDPRGGVKCNGHVYGLNWNALQGALMAWQRRGGWAVPLPSDDLISEWLDLVQRTIEQPEMKNVHMTPRQALVGGYEYADQAAFLTALPGIGGGKARQLLDKYDGQLTVILDVLTSPVGLDEPGIGGVTVQNIREFVRLRDGENWFARINGALLDELKQEEGFIDGENRNS